LPGQLVPLALVGKHRADARGKVGGERELAADIGRDLRRGVRRARGDRLVFADPLEAEHEAGEKEGVADRERLDEVLLDLAEDTAAAPGEGVAAIAGDADVEVRRLDDRAGVQAIL